ncbi:hypothetical protein CC1G_13899 [Coprinopsis cinerea okayama7|uniref:RNA polymerase I-specific transcription initiation factor RRN6 n=1 Tax=Coprinopsis cinerea (strain Okayama-7 / 130 / ATCC MYA-4618 / FGSC 9003) TaxID=240176 RepID=D6RKW7_COPC7|nr:hypothetical protein CC1G_13899 [Coprinopsis cinerea okayama7\|eukprot:XP_002911859.1 hypothetical protein CC1G_13899 [Coprinopsis cinerea okayama7\
MDSWPRDDRESRKSTSGDGGKKKVENITNGFPNLRQGMVGAATLVKKSGRLEWSFVQDSSSSQAKAWRVATSSSIFPNTRAPVLPQPTLTARQQGELQANFLRTYLPDVEVPAELVRDQIVEEVEFSKNLQRYDPYLGNLLVSLTKAAIKSNTPGILAFAMGEDLTQLNLSSYDIRKNKGITLKPVAEAKVTFKTPIQQLVATTVGADPFLTVRTYADINVLKLRKQDNTRAPESVVTIVKQEVADRSPVDVKLRSSTLIIADDHGGLHVRDLNFNSAITSLDPVSDSLEKENKFWRVGLGAGPTDGFLVSGKHLWSYDWRTQSRAVVQQWSIPSPRDFLTSVEDCSAENIVRLCSTNRLVWLDRRYMNAPLLSVLHYREHDRYLRTETLGTLSPLTFLTTRRNSLVSIYDASRGGDGLFHLRGSPYGVLPACGDSRSFLGETFITSPFESGRFDDIYFLRMSERGAITGHALSSSPNDEDIPIKVTTSKEMKQLEASAQKLAIDFGPLGGKENSEVNFFPVYDKLFRQYYDRIDELEESEAQAVYDLLETMPSYFQRSEQPSEQLLTTYDVAFRAGEEPQSASRSDFLTGSVLNSTRGYRALQQGRLDPGPLKNSVPWHFNLDNLMRRLDPELGVDLNPKNDSPAPYALEDDPERPLRSLKKEEKDRKQLELDLALSRDVYSTYPLTASADVDHTLETMTEALTLGDEPPPMELSFFKPVRKDHYDSEESAGQSASVEFGMGVRLLLKDWELGSSLNNYQYRDPYNTFDGPRVELEPLSEKAVYVPPPPAAVPPVVTQRPPTLVIAKPNPTSNQPPVLATAKTRQSQQTMPLWGMQTQSQTSEESQSQSMMPSTQILPGPFGGRPTAKKKPVKKRIGGF